MATTTTTTTTTPPTPLQLALNPSLLPPPTYAFTFTPHLTTHLPTLSHPSKSTAPPCPAFKTPAGCPRGPLCPLRHYVPPTERSGIGHLICKHYQRGLCKKGDACEFAHTFNLRDERECKEFSRYGICPQGDDCTYLHVPPTSRLREGSCPQYTRGFCPLGPYCALRHIKHPVPCVYYLAGFCPNGRSAPPEGDKVVRCVFGAHARWIKEEDLFPRKPEVRKRREEAEVRREQEEREEEFYAEEERRRERMERGEGGMGRWATGRRRGGRGGRGARRF